MKNTVASTNPTKKTKKTKKNAAVGYSILSVESEKEYDHAKKIYVVSVSIKYGSENRMSHHHVVNVFSTLKSAMACANDIKNGKYNVLSGKWGDLKPAAYDIFVDNRFLDSPDNFASSNKFGVGTSPYSTRIERAEIKSAKESEETKYCIHIEDGNTPARKRTTRKVASGLTF